MNLDVMTDASKLNGRAVAEKVNPAGDELTKFRKAEKGDIHEYATKRIGELLFILDNTSLTKRTFRLLKPEGTIFVEDIVQSLTEQGKSEMATKLVGDVARLATVIGEFPPAVIPYLPKYNENRCSPWLRFAFRENKDKPHLIGLGDPIIHLGNRDVEVAFACLKNAEKEGRFEKDYWLGLWILLSVQDKEGVTLREYLLYALEDFVKERKNQFYQYLYEFRRR